MLPRRLARLALAFLSALTLLFSALSAPAQIVNNPYKVFGPADEEREFVASHAGQPGSAETVATLKHLYTEAAKYYATDSSGRLFLLYNADGTDAGSKLVGVPLTWATFGAALKSSQIVIIRLTETPIADPKADKSASPPTPRIIEYTVRWLPTSAPAAPSATSSPAAPAATPTPLTSGDLANGKKAAAAVLAYLSVAEVQEDAFIKGHGDFRALVKLLNAESKKITSERGAPSQGDVAQLLDNLNLSISLLQGFGNRPMETDGVKHVAGKAHETEDSRVTALNMAKQFQDIKDANFPPADNSSDDAIK
jgi:hypothetical protein